MFRALQRLGRGGALSITSYLVEAYEALQADVLVRDEGAYGAIAQDLATRLKELQEGKTDWKQAYFGLKSLLLQVNESDANSDMKAFLAQQLSELQLLHTPANVLSPIQELMAKESPLTHEQASAVLRPLWREAVNRASLRFKHSRNIAFTSVAALLGGGFFYAGKEFFPLILFAAVVAVLVRFNARETGAIGGSLGPWLSYWDDLAKAAVWALGAAFLAGLTAGFYAPASAVAMPAALAAGAFAGGQLSTLSNVIPLLGRKTSSSPLK